MHFKLGALSQRPPAKRITSLNGKRKKEKKLLLPGTKREITRINLSRSAAWALKVKRKAREREREARAEFPVSCYIFFVLI